MILPGSYANGFAPRDGQPLYPELWRGCVGAWNPGLGPTGLTLRDWSGYGNHGTLTNMDAGTDWVASQGRYALDFDGSNDYVLCSSTKAGNVGASNVTFSIWVNTANTSAFRGFINKREGGGSFRQWCFGQGSINTGGGAVAGKYISLFWYIGGSLNSPGTVQNFRTTSDHIDGKMHHFAGTRTNGTVPKIYVDGVEVEVTAIVDGRTNLNADNDSNIEIGSLSRGANSVQGQVDGVQIYNRALSPHEIRLLATRRGIAYEMAPRRRASSAVQFNRRRRLLLGST
jgi:hypothetical protein